MMKSEGNIYGVEKGGKTSMRWKGRENTSAGNLRENFVPAESAVKANDGRRGKDGKFVVSMAILVPCVQ